MKKEGLFVVSLVLLVMCIYPVLSQDMMTGNDQMQDGLDTSGLQAIAIGSAIFTLIVYVYFSLSIMKTAEKLNISDKWKGMAWLPPVVPYLFSQMAKKKWWPAVVFTVAPFVMSIISSVLMVSSIQSGIASMVMGGSGMGGSIGYLIPQIISLLSVLTLIVFTFIWIWKICELRERPGWWAIVTPAAFVIGLTFIALKISSVAMIMIAIGILWQFVLWGVLGWSEKGYEARYREESEKEKKETEEEFSPKVKRLGEFISQGLEKGYSLEQLKEKIREKGWSREQLDKALDYSERIG